MDFIVSFLVSKIGFGLIIRGIYYSIIGIYILAVLSMFSSLVLAFFYFYDLIQSTISMINGGSFSGSYNLDYFFTVLNCSGFTPAFNDSSAIMIGGILFLLGRMAMVAAIVTYINLLRAITPLLGR